MKRWLALAMLVVLLTPVTWVRSPVPPRDASQSVTLMPVDAADAIEGALVLHEAWQLTSPNSDFGSYSALLVSAETGVLAASDRGRTLEIDGPLKQGTMPARIARFAGRNPYKKQLIDLESLVRDPASGRIWAGFEGSNAIERFNPGFTGNVAVRPPAMADWASNSGPEAMVRLADGRFIVLAEGPASWRSPNHAALLFDRDPVFGTRPAEFTFTPPAGFRPVDMALLPDGRVLILVRSFSLGIPPRFVVRLLVADPAEIEEGGQWRGSEVGAITDPRLADNYEGMDVVSRDDGSIDIWIISDDNNATFQRTLLLRLGWPDWRAGIE